MSKLIVYIIIKRLNNYIYNVSNHVYLRNGFDFAPICYFLIYSLMDLPLFFCLPPASLGVLQQKVRLL